MATPHDKQFKLDAVQYYMDHKELGAKGCAKKSNRHSGRITENIYRSVKEKVQEKVERKEHVSVTGMLKILGFSKTGYHSFLHHVCSKQEKRKPFLKDQIKKVYDESKQIYGAPKITKELQKKENISERTVGKYMI